MPNLTTSGSPTNNGDGSVTIDTTGSDIVTAPISTAAGALDETQSWYAVRLRAGESSATAAGRTPKPVFFNWADAAGTWMIAYVEGDQSVRMLRASGGVGSPVSKAATWALGDDITVIYAWTATTLKVSFNGSVFTTLADANIPALADTTIDFCSSANEATRQINGAVWWQAMGTGTLADADAATFNGFGNTDPAWAAIPGTRILLWRANDFTYIDADDGSAVVGAFQ